MKNLFFTAIAMMAFSFAGNAKNLVNSSKSINLEKVVSITTFTKSSKLDDCKWTVVSRKVTKITFADGSQGYAETKVWKCI